MRKYIQLRRVSTDQQGDSKLGLEAQARVIEQFVQAEGGEIVADYIEIISGGDHDRPVLMEAIAEAKRRKCWIAVSKLDRLSRDVEVVAGLMNKGVKFVVAELGHDVDPFLLHLYAALGEKERKLIGQRTREALASLKAQGRVLGNVVTLEQHRAKGHERQAQRAREDAANILPIIREIQSLGRTTLAAIAEDLNKRNVQTARGGRWHKASVARVLQRIG